MAQSVKNLPAMQETLVQSLDWEDPLEKEMVIHSSILALEVPWAEGLAGYDPWGHKESDMAERLTHTPELKSVFVCAVYTHTHTHTHTHIYNCKNN